MKNYMFLFRTALIIDEKMATMNVETFKIKAESEKDAVDKLKLEIMKEGLQMPNTVALCTLDRDGFIMTPTKTIEL